METMHVRGRGVVLWQFSDPGENFLSKILIAL